MHTLEADLKSEKCKIYPLTNIAIVEYKRTSGNSHTNELVQSDFFLIFTPTGPANLLKFE